MKSQFNYGNVWLDPAPFLHRILDGMICFHQFQRYSSTSDNSGQGMGRCRRKGRGAACANMGLTKDDVILCCP